MITRDEEQLVYDLLGNIGSAANIAKMCVEGKFYWTKAGYLHKVKQEVEVIKRDADRLLDIIEGAK